MERKRPQNESQIKRTANKVHRIIMSQKTPVVLTGLNGLAFLSKLLEGDINRAGISGFGMLAAGVVVAIEKGESTRRKRKNEL